MSERQLSCDFSNLVMPQVPTWVPVHPWNTITNTHSEEISPCHGGVCACVYVCVCESVSVCVNVCVCVCLLLRGPTSEFKTFGQASSSRVDDRASPDRDKDCLLPDGYSLL